MSPISLFTHIFLGAINFPNLCALYGVFMCYINKQAATIPPPSHDTMDTRLPGINAKILLPNESFKTLAGQSKFSLPDEHPILTQVLNIYVMGY